MAIVWQAWQITPLSREKHTTLRFVVLASGAISHAVAPQLLKRDRRWALGGIDFARLALNDAITHR